jgi:hypothetical protein
MPKYDWLFDLQRIAESAHILCEIADVPSRGIAWIAAAGAAQVGEDQLSCVRECSAQVVIPWRDVRIRSARQQSSDGRRAQS